MNQEIFEQVRDIVADLLDIDPEMITPESKFQADLGADSLDLVELIMEFEEQLGGEISDEDAQKITTVGEAVDFMEALMKSEEVEEGAEEVTAEAEPEEAETPEEEPGEPEVSEQDEEVAEETPVGGEAKEGEAEESEE